jgi:hypothetical protein
MTQSAKIHVTKTALSGCGREKSVRTISFSNKAAPISDAFLAKKDERVIIGTLFRVAGAPESFSEYTRLDKNW